MSVPTPKQVVAANKYHSYMRGWLSGVANKTTQEISHDAELNAVQLEGYTAGQLALQDAKLAAGILFEYQPSILRTKG